MVEEQEQAQPAEARAEEAAPSILDEIVSTTLRIGPQDESFAKVRRGLDAFLREMLTPARKKERVDKRLVDQMIAELDHKMSSQLDEVLHNERFQQMESAWRGLKLVVDRTDFRQDNRIELLNVSKDDLIADFEDSPEITKSGLYRTVYTAEYGQFGGKPVGAMVANYDFGPGPQDMELLSKVASVAAMAHAPFIAAAGPQFFGADNYLKLPNMKDLKSHFEGPKFIKWQSFRESEDARYVGLTAPRFLLRLPYGKATKPVKAFNYEESVSGRHDRYLWGNASFAFATRLTDSFAKYGWCTNIIGPKAGGAVEDLPLHQFDSLEGLQTKIPTEILISERREFELSEEGFIPLTMRKDSDNACFFSANSCQKPKLFGGTKEGKAAELNYRLGTQLPYLFIVNRFAHYIKTLQREQIGTWKERVDLERELNNWIRQYVVDMDNPMPGVRSRRPLRQAQITVEDVEGQAGWYRVDMKLRPHFKYMGAHFTLSLVGKLDKK